MSKLINEMRVPAWGSCVRLFERLAAVVRYSRDNASGSHVGTSFCADGKGSPAKLGFVAERFPQMLTTSNAAAVNGHSSDINRVFPMHGPAGDSAVLIVPISPNFPGFDPEAPTSFPYERTIGMPRKEANELAVSLNRRVLKAFPDVPHWFIVAYGRSGFCVMRIHAPSNWKPENEYSLPPTYISRAMNCEARQEAKTVNRIALRSGHVEEWALHIKELLPVVEDQDEAKPEADEVLLTGCTVNSHHMLTENERRIIAILKNVMGEDSIGWDNSNGRGVMVHLTGYRPVINITDTKDDDIVNRLTDLAGDLLEAARMLEGKPEPQLAVLQPLNRSVTISGSEDVEFTVFNCDNDQEAFNKVRHLIGTLKR